MLLVEKKKFNNGFKLELVTTYNLKIVVKMLWMEYFSFLLKKDEEGKRKIKWEKCKHAIGSCHYNKW